jgi:hypothetical protein
VGFREVPEPPPRLGPLPRYDTKKMTIFPPSEQELADEGAYMISSERPHMHRLDPFVIVSHGPSETQRQADNTPPPGPSDIANSASAPAFPLGMTLTTMIIDPCIHSGRGAEPQGDVLHEQVQLDAEPDGGA